MQALEEELRIDGRRPYDYRNLQLQAGLLSYESHVTLTAQQELNFVFS